MLGNNHNPTLSWLIRRPWAVELGAHSCAHRLHQQPHGFSGHCRIAFDAQYVLLFCQDFYLCRQCRGVGLFGQGDHDALEILVIVIMGAVVMRRTGVEVILGGVAKSKDHPGIARSLGYLDHWQRALGFGGDLCAGSGDTFRTGQVWFGQLTTTVATDLHSIHFC